MGLNLVTDYPLGLFKKVPFKWHRIVEMTSPPIFIVGPWYFFADAGLMPWTASAVGLGAVMNALLTRPGSLEDSTHNRKLEADAAPLALLVRDDRPIERFLQ